jgi:DnaJ-class molecular chaperone
MADTEYYKILGVEKTASDAEIKQAYRKQALEWHPDKHTGKDKETAEAKFKKINQAYEVLRDPQKRQTYDQFGAEAFKQGGPAGQGSPFGGGFRQGPFTYSYSSGGNVNFEDLFGGFSDPFDIFEQFFGGGTPFGQRRQHKPVYELALTFNEAVQGVEKTVEIDGKSKNIKIPAGVDNGNRIRFSDFDLVIRVHSSDTFKRQGQDLIVDVPISFPLASLGGSVEVPTLDKPFKVKVRSGTQPGTVLRLRGMGIPYPNSRNKGDLYIRLMIAVPKNLSRRQKELLEEFEKS